MRRENEPRPDDDGVPQGVQAFLDGKSPQGIALASRVTELHHSDAILSPQRREAMQTEILKLDILTPTELIILGTSLGLGQMIEDPNLAPQMEATVGETAETLDEIRRRTDLHLRGGMTAAYFYYHSLARAIVAPTKVNWAYVNEDWSDIIRTDLRVAPTHCEGNGLLLGFGYANLTESRKDNSALLDIWRHPSTGFSSAHRGVRTGIGIIK